MSEVTHDDIAWFAGERINLPKAIADKHRRQVNLLRERLEAKIDEDLAFDLIKMLHAGSVAKGTALRTVNDLDVAWDVKSRRAPKGDNSLIPVVAGGLAGTDPS